MLCVNKYTYGFIYVSIYIFLSIFMKIFKCKFKTNINKLKSINSNISVNL